MNLTKLVGRQAIYHYLQNLSYSFNLNISRPSLYILKVTYNCNLKCKHCSRWKLNDTEELTTQEWKKVISDIAKFTPGAYLVFSGGEPTLRKDLPELINWAHKKKLCTMITTNGTVSKTTAKNLVKSKIDFIKISMDGHGVTHNCLRGMDSSFDKILYLVNSANQHKKKVMINTIISNDSQDSIHDLFKFIKEKKVFAIEFQPILPDLYAPHKEDWYKTSDLWPKDYSKMCNSINTLKDYKKKGFPVLNSMTHLELMKKYYKDPNQKFEGKCMAHYQRIIINPDGKIKMCFNYTAGNAKNEKIRDIWNKKSSISTRLRSKKCHSNCLIFHCNYGESLKTRANKFFIFFNRSHKNRK